MKRAAIGVLLTVALSACGEEAPVQPQLPTSQGVNFGIASRVEVDDSIIVAATDEAGITKIGWIARLADGTVFGGDSTDLGDGGREYYEQLYDLANDPHETTNLADKPEHADILEKLRKRCNTLRDQAK